MGGGVDAHALHYLVCCSCCRQSTPFCPRCFCCIDAEARHLTALPMFCALSPLLLVVGLTVSKCLAVCVCMATTCCELTIACAALFLFVAYPAPNPTNTTNSCVLCNAPCTVMDILLQAVPTIGLPPRGTFPPWQDKESLMSHKGQAKERLQELTSLCDRQRSKLAEATIRASGLERAASAAKEDTRLAEDQVRDARGLRQRRGGGGFDTDCQRFPTILRHPICCSTAQGVMYTPRCLRRQRRRVRLYSSRRGIRTDSSTYLKEQRGVVRTAGE